MFYLFAPSFLGSFISSFTQLFICSSIYIFYLFIYFKVAFLLGLLKAKDDAVLYLLVVNLLGKM